MARPRKQGLDFYSTDTDIFYNRKIKRLLKSFNSRGYLVYSFVLSEIYRSKGYFLLWDEDSAFDVADYTNLKESLVNDVINFCIKSNLFDEEIFEKHSVLTNKKIQSFWLEVSKKAKRKDVEIIQEYSLLQPKQEETLPNKEETISEREETASNKEESTQRKGKERKGKKYIKKDDPYDHLKFLKTFNQYRLKKLDVKGVELTNLTTPERMKFDVLKNRYNQNDFEHAINGLFCNTEIFRKCKLRPFWLLDEQNFVEMIDSSKTKKKVYEKQRV